MNGATDWSSALAILAGGLILGTLIIFAVNKRRSRSRHADPDLTLADLEAKRDALVAQLRDPSTAEAERTRVEIETAQVLRAIDEHRVAKGVVADAPSRTVVLHGMNPTIKGFLWGFGSFTALALLGYFVMQSAKPREEGGSLTGGFESGSTAAPQQAPAAMNAQLTAEIARLEKQIESAPNDLTGRKQLAGLYMQSENWTGVFAQTQYVLERVPEDSVALTYQAVVRMAMGDSDAASQMFVRATKSDPRNLDAWVMLAWIKMQDGKMAEAEQLIATAAQQRPDERVRLGQVLEQMKVQVANPPQRQASAGPLPPGQDTSQLPQGHPPVEGAASDPSKVIKVTLQLDPSARARAAGGGTIFVTARAAGVTAGPPIAAKRITATSFPITLDFSSADSMMGQQLPERIRLEARLDSDGDARSKLPTDPLAAVDDVAPGSVVTLLMK